MTTTVKTLTRRRAIVGLALAALAAAALAVFALRDRPPQAPTERTPAAPYSDEEEEPLRYAVEYPTIGYETREPTDAVARLQQRLARGEATLELEPGRGYLDSLLAALDIDVASQVLVFSKTSLQSRGITPRAPRAIYFNDDVYVAQARGVETLEIGAMDPELGPVFYQLRQDPSVSAPFERHAGRCLRCHDSYSLSGGGVPRFITGSGYTGIDGRLVAHEGWILTSDRTPLRSRWGGWYVSGYSGDQVHLGNIAVKDAAELQQLERLRTGNLETLEGLFDTSPYPTNTSDIVALLVLEHQVDVQNAITRTSYDVRTALHRAADGTAESGTGGELPPATVAELTEPLVEALFLAGEAELGDRISGTSGFAEGFVARGPVDRQGRSLRDLELRTRLFTYPLSYLVYSAAFEALPDVAKRYVYARFAEILSGRDRSQPYARLGDAERSAIVEILADTKPEAVAGRQRD
jgi:hypothetical protein